MKYMVLYHFEIQFVKENTFVIHHLIIYII